ncbi:MAG: S9 family peptidase [Bacteroidota bacterium]
MQKLLTYPVLFLILILTAGETFSQNDYKKITLDDIYKKNKFRQKSVEGLRSMNDGLHYTVLKGGSAIVKYSYKSGQVVDTLLDLSDYQDLSAIDRYAFSDEEHKILIATDIQPIYRRSFIARYFIFDRRKETLEPLTEAGKQKLATFSPDASKVGFVRNNNLFVKDLATGEVEQVTHDGKHNHIINGSTDWVYEEEFAFTQGFHWSPEGDKIAFYKFNESRVKKYNMPMYRDSLYPENNTFKYPKAGEKNSIVEIYVYDLQEGTVKEMDTGEETDQYIPRIKWTGENDKLCMIRMNRLQNKIEIMLATANTGESEVIYEETDEYYISQIGDDYPTFIDDGDHFIIYSEKSGYNQLYLYDIQGNLVQQITEGNWEVTEFLGYDEKSNRVFYASTEESPLTRSVYSIKKDGSGKKEITGKEGWNSANFSSGFKYYINYHSRANEPMTVTLHKRNGELIRVLEDNEELKENAAEYGFQEKQFIRISTPSSDYDLNAYMITPPDFDENKQYPLFMYLYGGPGSQEVTERWGGRMAWLQMLAQRGYVIAVVDNRGTGGRGEQFKKMTYGQLGKYETIDQTEAAKYFGDKSYIDAGRIGIFGWSYGGYMSSNCLFQSSEIFSMAIAVAPVTNWRYYDTIYTERYMGLPQDNPDGYDDNSPINHVDGLKGDYLLIHGTGDDNVHLQNSIELAEELVQADKQFQMQFYPDKNHGIYGGNTTYHLYTRMTDFILENL